MISLQPLFHKASHSKLGLWQLNQVLWRLIPFNSPHRFKVIRVEEDALTIELPYIRKNLNHIRGLHACALAALSEYVCGLHLIKVLGTEKYRIILKSLKMDYHYQGKQTVRARFELSMKNLHTHILDPLKTEEVIIPVFTIEVFDLDNRLIAKGYPEWQIKPWAQVRTHF